MRIKGMISEGGKKMIRILSTAFLDGVLNVTYIIEKQEVRLIGGRAEVQGTPGSAIKITTAVFGEPVFGDLDGDSQDDDATVFIGYRALSQDYDDGYENDKFQWDVTLQPYNGAENPILDYETRFISC